MSKKSPLVIHPIYLRGSSAFPRSVLCSSALKLNRDDRITFVLGSADHSLKHFEIPHLSLPSHAAASLPVLPCVRTLHSKRYGHSEWVPTCTLLRDGRVLSGGMDGRVCLWSKTGVRCDDLMEGTSPGNKRQNNLSATMVATSQSFPISRVLSGTCDGRVWALAASYDGTVRAWDLEKGFATPTTEFRGPHNRNPVGSAVWSHQDGNDVDYDDESGVSTTRSSNLLFTGGKDSKLAVWDFETSRPIVVFKGQVGPVDHILRSETIDSNIVVGAGREDARVLVWDVRSRTCAAKLRVGGGGGELRDDDVGVRGAALFGTSTSDAGRIVVVDTSGTVRLIDRNSKTPVTITGDNSSHVFTVKTCGRRIFCGHHDGSVSVHEIDGNVPLHVATLSPESALGSTNETSLAVVKGNFVIDDREFGRASQSFTIRTLSIVPSRDGRQTVIAGNDHGECFVWDLPARIFDRFGS